MEPGILKVPVPGIHHDTHCGFLKSNRPVGYPEGSGRCPLGVKGTGQLFVIHLKTTKTIDPTGEREYKDISFVCLTLSYRRTTLFFFLFKWSPSQAWLHFSVIPALRITGRSDVPGSL